MASRDRPRLPQVRALTLRDQALEVLRAAILDGQLPPGTRLHEINLSAELGLSRGTIREAILGLAEEQLVVSHNRRGTYVRMLTAAEIRDIYAVRASLEALAMRLAAERPREEIEPPLQIAFKRFEDAQAASFPERIAADFAFHETIWILSRNSCLPIIWRTLTGPLRTALLTAGEEVVRPAQSVADHRELMEAVLRGDPEGAASLVVSHALRAGAALSEALSTSSLEYGQGSRSTRDPSLARRHG